MTDRDFLLTIIENPKEDGPRLVFADWLEETGRCERGEFIRIQCELALLEATEPCLKYGTYGCAQFICEGKCRPCQKKYPLKVREAELRDKNINEWFWGSLTVIQFCSIGWFRGFLSEVSLTESDFMKCAPQLCWHPIEKVTLTDRNTINTGGEVRREFRWWNKKWFDSLRIVSDIEEDIWNRIENYAVGFSTVKIFHSEEAAVSALEQGCLSYLNSLRTPESCIASDDFQHSGTENTASV